MVNLERAWGRIAQRFPGLHLNRMRPQVFISTYSLGTGAETTNQNVTFPAGALILGIQAGAHKAGEEATQLLRRGLELFKFSASMLSDNRALVGPVQGLAAAVLGENGDQFPQLEIFLREQTTLIYSFTNLSTSDIVITLAHHAIVPGDVS